MGKDWSYGEAIKGVFPLLDGSDLASCMMVCRQWRDVARDEYFWKRICAKRWPSICQRPPPALSYRELYSAFSRPRRPQPLLPSRLSFDALEFYIDLWADDDLIFSRSISGPTLLYAKNPSPGIPELLMSQLNSSDYKMTVQVDPKFSVPISQTVTASILTQRKDTCKVACLLNQSVFDYVDRSAMRALAFGYLTLSPGHPFVPGIRVWVSLLFTEHSDESISDVFGIEIDFSDAASSENELLWLLDMLDWK